MKRLFFTALVTLMIFFLFQGCTRIPLSYMSIPSNSKLLGVWQETPSISWLIWNSSAYNTKVARFSWDDKLKKRVLESARVDVYITTLSDNIGSMNFLSIGKPLADDDPKGTYSGYQHFKYYINSNNELVLAEISRTVLNKFDPTYLNDLEKFQYLVKTKMRDQSFYKAPVIYSKKEIFEK